MFELPNVAKSKINELRAEAELLENMAGVYPGDVSGDLSTTSFILRYMADTIEDTKWREVLANYESDRPKIVVTLFDKDGNEVR